MKNIYLHENKYIYLPDYNIITNSESKYLFHNSSLEKVKIIDIPINKKSIMKSLREMKKITFEMTQDCNLRCEYCVYGKYYPNDRNRTNKSIDFETAKKAIDHLNKFISEKEIPFISIIFYGGEALLNFNTLKNIVDYSKKTFLSKKILFSLNTNGTLLNKEIIRYLIYNNFHIAISLDGPKEIHDTKRKNAAGRGSFRSVEKNLLLMKELDNQYYKENVSFTSVWSPELEVLKIYKYFINNELVNKNMIRFTFVKSIDTNYLNAINFNAKKAMNDMERIKTIIYKKLLNSDKLKPIEKYIFDDLNIRALGEKILSSLLGSCLGGENILIDSFGKYHLCHLVNDKFPIGDVDQGFYYNFMIKLINNYKEVVKRYCYNCEIRFICDRCYKDMFKNREIRLDPIYCKTMKYRAMIKLEDYIKININGLEKFFYDE